jgi:Ser/Thr protein kinase RdoA (MazF antagonist)
MEPFIRNLLSEDILETALGKYAIQPQDAVILDGFESFIYLVRKNEKEFILRIGHDSRRTSNLVQGESEFLNHLAEGGLSVPQVLPSSSQNLVEIIPSRDGSNFLTTLFEKAPGCPPKQKQWNSSLHIAMGAFMGKLHYLSKAFKPSQPKFARYNLESDSQQMAEQGKKYLPKSDSSVITAYLNTLNTIQQLPKEPSAYGLCHTDFHRGNFFVTDAGRITLFDFDDCHYAWFIYDIAMALFYAISHDCATPAKLAEAESFLANFWQGYQQENGLDPQWLEQIPLFLRLREIDLYMLIHRSMDLSNLDPWCDSFMTRRREKILNHQPFCDINYAKMGSV